MGNVATRLISIIFILQSKASVKAAELAEAAGIKVVMDRCPKIELTKPYWTGVEA